jgi:hypothetical protein
MPLTIINIKNIGTGGMNTDSPPWAVGSTQASHMQDVVIYEGIAHQRRGYENYLDFNSSASSVVDAGTYDIRATGQRISAMTAIASGNYAVYATNHAAPAWTSVVAPTGISPLPQYLARAQYQDEILFCDQLGIYPMLRYMGNTAAPITALGTSIAAGSAVVPVTGATFASSVNTDTGLFLHPYVSQEAPSLRVTKRDNANFTVKNINFAAAASNVSSLSVLSPWGTTWPAVSVNSDGLVTWSGSTITGDGTQFTGGSWGSVFVGSGQLAQMNDSIRAQEPTKWVQYPISSLGSPSATTLNTRGTLISVTGSVAFDVMRRCPFREVEIHQECVWGTGVSQYPRRVYYSPPQWDLQTPPGLAPPWNGVAEFFDPNDGRLRFTDIEGSGDGDRVMALISSDGPLLILTSRACWGAYGTTWPNFQRQLVAAGAGCIDTRAAVSQNAYGQYWAGENGIYGFRAGKVTDLTSGRINTQWRDLMRRYEAGTGSYVVAGLARNHLIVSAHLTRGGTDKDVTLACNLGTGAWSELTNIPATSFQMPAIASEETLVTSLKASNQLVNLSPALAMTGTAKDANGVAPQLSITLGSGNHDAGDPDGEARLVELRLNAVVEDATIGDDPSALRITTVSDGAVAQEKTSRTSSEVISAQTDDDLSRVRVRVGNAGRTHAVTIATETTANANERIGVVEVGMNVRKRRASR